MGNISGMYDKSAEPQADFSAIPTGEYKAVMIDSAVKQVNPPKTGKYLDTAYEITEGQYKGRKLWHNITLQNPSQQAVDIGNRQLASIRQATGAMDAEDSQEFHYKPIILRVEFIPAGTEQKNGYVTPRDTNEIKAWKKSDGAATAVRNNAGSSPFAAKPETTNANGAPTWAQKAA